MANELLARCIVEPELYQSPGNCQMTKPKTCKEGCYIVLADWGCGHLRGIWQMNLDVWQEKPEHSSYVTFYSIYIDLRLNPCLYIEMCSMM